MPSAPATDLWDDWCAVTGTDSALRDEDTLDRFAHQASPSRRLLEALRATPPAPRAPAWPRPLQGRDTLAQVLTHSWDIAEHPQTHWVDRLRLRRLRFIAVLLAPRDQGGLGLDRARLRGLTPAALQQRRASITTAARSQQCPACAVWSWLQVVGTSSGWSHFSVRALAYQPQQLVDDEHCHEQPDPSPDWLTCAGLVPAIDRWGYLDPYQSLHPSSISVLTHQLEELLDIPVPVSPATEPDHDPDQAIGARSLTRQEQEQVFARADELNARINRILAEYG